MFLQRVILWSAIGVVMTLVMAACGGNKISECQKRGYDELTKEYGGQPPQAEVDKLTKECVDRYGSK